MIDNSLRILNRHEIEPEVWDSFVDASDEAWLWHRYDFQDALATWPKRTDLSFAILDTGSGDTLVAVVPVQLVEIRTANLFYRNSLNSLGGIACSNGLGDKHKRKVRQFGFEWLKILAGRQRAIQIELCLASMSPAWRGECCPRVNPLIELGYDNVLTQTWVVDLRPGSDVLWKKLEGRTRTAIRKAEKMGVTVRMAHRPEDLDTYYQLHCETYHRTAVRPHPKEYFESIWLKFLNVGLAYILFAEYDNEVVAAENFGIYKQAAIYWTGAASTEGLSTNANALLQWTAMQWMCKNGLHWYETGEAFPGTQTGKLKGLSDFKKSFGGELYPYYKGRLVTSKKAYLIDCLRILQGLK